MAVAAAAMASSAFALTSVSPLASGPGGIFWDFGALDSDDYVSDTALDVATDVPKFIDFFAQGEGTLTISVTNSGTSANVLTSAQLLCFSGCTLGSYDLSFDGTLLSSVQSGDGQSLSSFMLGAGESGDLVWDWSVPSTPALGGQVSTNLNAEAAPIPVPAGGLLLISALGGIGLMRRRKS